MLRSKMKNKENKNKKCTDKVVHTKPEVQEDQVMCFFNVTDSFYELLQDAKVESVNKVLIIGQESVDTEEIEDLNKLTELWITESNLEEVPRIMSTNLTKLYLHSNNLTYVQDISYLSHLKVLWLNDNDITSIEYICECVSLEELFLANNQISHLNYLHKLESLRTLNMSGNPIYDIEEINKLIPLAKLSHLMFCDPMFKISPIANIVNYRIIVVYNLPNLSSLDTFSVTENEITNAQEHYRMKKITYSNMFHKLYNDYYQHLKDNYYNSKEQLENIRQRYINCVLTEKQAKEKNQLNILERCKWDERHLENDILGWETQYKQQDRQYEQLIQMNMNILDFEMCYAGKVQLDYYDSRTDLSFYCQQLLQEYTCSFSSREAYVESIEVDGVTHIQDRLTQADKLLELINTLRQKEKSVQFYVLLEPVSVTDINDWPFELVKKYFSRFTDEDYNDIMYTVTNCLATADSTWLNSNEIHKKVFLSNQKNSKRFAVLVCVPSRNSLTKLASGKNLHPYKVKASEGEKTGICCKYLVNVSNCFPVFIVQFHYIYQDLMKTYEKLIYTDNKIETNSVKKNVIPNPVDVTSLDHQNWKTLTNLSLTNLFLSNFGDVANNIYQNIINLDVSLNCLNGFEEINQMFPKLQELNISYNVIKNLDSIKGFEYLENLNVSWNKITNLRENLEHLNVVTPKLLYLDIKYNCFEDTHFSGHEPLFAKKILPNLKKFNEKWMAELDVCKVKKLEGIYDLPVISDDPFNHIAGSNIEWAGDGWFQIEKLRSSHMCVSPIDKTITCLCLIGGQYFHQLRFTISLPGLTSLTVSGNLLQEVSFLEHLPHLKRLDLSKNMLNNNINVAYNQDLIYLDLSCNYITSLDFMRTSNLHNLKVFNISMNLIKSLKGLENLNGLEQLYASCNHMHSYEGIQPLKNLQNLIIVDLNNNPFPTKRDSYKCIANISKSVEFVNGSPLSDSDFTPVSSYNNWLDADYLLRIYKITTLHGLSELTIQKSNITKVNLDAGVLHNLTSINLESNQVDRLSDLACLPNLTNLCLSHNRVKKFKGMENEDYIDSSVIFEKLEMLHLDDNGITEIDSLELYRMPNLKTLFLQDNNITSLSGLHKARSILNLVLDRNRIRSVTGTDLSGMHSLSQLYLENNYLENLQCLSSVPKLTKLFIANNRIYDIANLHWLTCTKHLTELTISGNPVNSCANLMKFLIQTLQHLTLLNGYQIK